MEFTIGVLVGVALTLVVLGAGFWLRRRRSESAPLSPMPTFEGEPSVMVMMIEPFLNHQLRDALAAEAALEAAELGQKTSRVKIKLNDATLDVQTGQRAKFYTLLTVTAWNFPVQLRPIADMHFGLSDGRVKITVTGIQLGGFNVPRALVDRFVSQVVETSEAKLNHSLMQLQRDTGVELAVIETTEDLLILKFIEPRAAHTTVEQGAVT